MSLLQKFIAVDYPNYVSCIIVFAFQNHKNHPFKGISEQRKQKSFKFMTRVF